MDISTQDIWTLFMPPGAAARVSVRHRAPVLPPLSVAVLLVLLWMPAVGRLVIYAVCTLRVLDADESGEISLEEFVEGCMQLQGPAQSVQLARMRYEAKITRQEIKRAEEPAEEAPVKKKKKKDSRSMMLSSIIGGFLDPAFRSLVQGASLCISAATSSLQRPQSKEVISREFNLRLGGWFPALKWLIKEFRLRIGYETPDEEAGIRFWIRQFSPGERHAAEAPSEPASWVWPTADEPVLPATKQEVRQARTWTLEQVERQMTSFFELKRQLCPSMPILVPLKELRLHHVKTGRATSPEQMRLHRKEDHT
eukprot:s9135_g2.t1